jgi:type IV secretory pathway VirB10-like protein
MSTTAKTSPAPTPALSMEGPSGIDLHPAPPDPARLSKRAGILFLAVICAVVGFIIYGMYERNQRRFGAATGQDTQHVTAATEAEAQILSMVPEKVVAAQAAGSAKDDDLKPPVNSTDLTNASSQAPNASLGGASQPSREPTPKEQRRARLYEQELAAMEAPTTSSGGTSTPMQSPLTNVPGTGGDAGEVSALLQAMRPASSTGVSVPSAVGSTPTSVLPRTALASGYSASEEYQSQNMQDQKAAFLASARNKAMDDYLATTRLPPVTRFVIRAGWDIPAVLEQGINSDLPGETRALVRENVYDTATGRYLLVPQGSRLVGHYNSQVAFGQNGLQVAWDRLIFPDASSIDLAGMSGQDSEGRSGFRDSVDNHYKRLVAFGLLTSLFSAALQISQNHSSSVLTYPSNGSVAAGAVGQQMAELGTETTRRNLNVQPTVKIAPGYRFNVRVNRDLAFEAAYRPLQPASR